MKLNDLKQLKKEPPKDLRMKDLRMKDLRMKDLKNLE